MTDIDNNTVKSTVLDRMIIECTWGNREYGHYSRSQDLLQQKMISFAMAIKILTCSRITGHNIIESQETGSCQKNIRLTADLAHGFFRGTLAFIQVMAFPFAGDGPLDNRL